MLVLDEFELSTVEEKLGLVSKVLGMDRSTDPCGTELRSLYLLIGDVQSIRGTR